MASMDDLIATTRGLHAGQQGNDLKDLQATLQNALHPTVPTYRPVPPTQSNSTHTAGPMPPPAPASSWNSPPPTGSSYLHSSSPSFAAFGTGNSPRQAPINLVNRETGFAPRPKDGPITINGNVNGNIKAQGGAGVGINQNQNQNQNRPYHAEVLPIRASPKDTGGFAEDAFAPLWKH